MIPLPTWMSGEMVIAWEDYISQRVKDRKAMTLRSAAGRLKRLQDLRDAGHDPMQCLEEAINGHWLDFYAPKDKPIERKAATSSDERIEAEKRYQEAEKERLDAYISRTATKPPPGLRRVA
jgi:hypothetical protein